MDVCYFGVDVLFATYRLSIKVNYKTAVTKSAYRYTDYRVSHTLIYLWQPAIISKLAIFSISELLFLCLCLLNMT